jgi:hypothetical protein
LFDRFSQAAREFGKAHEQSITRGEKPPDTALAQAFNKALWDVLPGQLNFWSLVRVEEFLSPIGIAHFYRQIYFNVKETVGPLETAFTVAPLETLEVVYTTTRRQVHEEVLEVGSETTTEVGEEVKEIDEVSDKVSFMLQHDASASMSARGGVTVGVFEGSGSSEGQLSTTSQQSGEEATRRLKEVTRRASERITKSFRIQTRDLEEFTSTNLTRRVIENKTDKPVSYGLRRVLRKVLVKVQSLGPRLIWQVYVRDPGKGLILSKFVHFREAEPIAVPDVPPGVPPRPVGGAESGSDILTEQNPDEFYPDLNESFLTLTLAPGRDRLITTVVIDSVYLMDSWGNPNRSFEVGIDQPALSGGAIVFDSAAGTYTVIIGLNPGLGPPPAQFQVNYTYRWDPAQAIMDAWEAQRLAAVEKATQEALEAEFQKQKTLITEKSKIRGRPAADLRREERYETMSRLISDLFGADPEIAPQPLDIEAFHKYFDLESMFSYTHPSWWKPRTRSSLALAHRLAYEITAESEPAPMGRSIGWHIQLDGDTRRNEFLNSPWVRTCIPIRPGNERQALAWLAKHVEGDIGYDPSKEPLKGLLAELEVIRARETAVGAQGPEYVAVDSAPTQPPPTTGSSTVAPTDVYPIIAEFDVTVPTDGFVYDTLSVV